MTYHPDDTICAIATAVGGAVRGMIRVSGPRAIAVAAACFEAADGRCLSEVQRAGCVTGFLNIELTAGGEPRAVPCELFVWPSKRSYTREPVVELHTIGSPPILEAALAAVCLGGARLAEPGEFTLRAFLAGRIDLTQAEAVLGVIDAQAESDLKTALGQLAGGLARPLDRLRDQLLQILAELEAGLDFVDQNIEFITSADLVTHLEHEAGLLRQVFDQMTRRGAIGGTTRVTLFGSPNAGKSSLFNALVGKFGVPIGTSTTRGPAAIVSSRRGTTRDYLTATIEFDGISCELIDTAGIDERQSLLSHESTHDEKQIQEVAQGVAIEQRQRAAIRVWCVDGAGVEAPNPISIFEPSDGNCDAIVITKADLSPTSSLENTRQLLNRTSIPAIFTSSVTGEGLDDFRQLLRDLLTRESCVTRGQVVTATADRCRESIRMAEAALERAKILAIEDAGNELVALELREALAELGKVVGAVYTDDLLDRIFKTFCIGK